ncbi:MAG: hypothetical protein ACYC61_04470 [Isosphaeraceae bacterium]
MSSEPVPVVPDRSTWAEDSHTVDLASADAGSPGLDEPTRGELVKTFVAMGISQGILFGFFWSLWMWMSVWRNQSLAAILLGPGLGGGLFFGLSMAIFMAVYMRPTTVEIPIGDTDAFLRRLYAETARLRYRTLGQTDGLRIFGPRTPVRPKAFRLRVRIEPGKATIAGPRANIRVLKKRLEK